MSKNLWIGLIVIVVIILAGWYLTRPKQEQFPATSTPVPTATTSSEATDGAMVKEEVSINITADGFAPKDITIKVGDTVTWMNSDVSLHNVNSVPHPTHTTYPPLNLGKVAVGEKVSLMFDKAGTYNYHDHLNPSLFGSVTVE